MNIGLTQILFIIFICFLLFMARYKHYLVIILISVDVAVIVIGVDVDRHWRQVIDLVWQEYVLDSGDPTIAVPRACGRPTVVERQLEHLLVLLCSEVRAAAAVLH